MGILKRLKGIGAKQGKAMHDFPKYRDHLMESLKNPHEAAYYLAACLEDAIAENDHGHFFQAAAKVARATQTDVKSALRLLHSHIAPADFPNVDENLSILVAQLMQQVNADQDHLQEA
jgi:hypothetical protein